MAETLTASQNIQIIRTERLGYPDAPVPELRRWSDDLPDYDPPFYSRTTADPEITALNNNAISVAIRANRLTALRPLSFDKHRYPQNPDGRTGISGRGNLHYYGPNLAADLLPFHFTLQEQRVLLLERSDTGLLAFPGGFLEPTTPIGPRMSYERPMDGAIREAYEETGLYIGGLAVKISAATHQFEAFNSPRNTDSAWIETSAFFAKLSGQPINKLVPNTSDEHITADWYHLDDIDPARLSSVHAMYLTKLQQLAVDFLK